MNIHSRSVPLYLLITCAIISCGSPRSPDVKRLRAFKKVDLAPGETKTISFKLSAKDLSFINSQNKRIAEAGEFTIQVNNLNRLLTLSESVVF